MRTRSVCAAILAALCGSLSAQSPFASSVVSFQQGTGGGIFVQANILGGPQGGGLGGGSLHVLTLGENGSVVLGFDVAILDGPGADLAVFENGFKFGSGFDVFAELGYVEVSTDGVQFARFPSVWNPPNGGSTSVMGTSSLLGGGMPVLSNVVTNSISPFDPVRAGGEHLDLDALAQDPLVLGGQVDLQEIRFVRLVDVPPSGLDSLGTTITSGAVGGADFDAVAALNHDAEAAGEPVFDLGLDGAGQLTVRLGDPDGFGDLDPSTLSMSLNLVEVPFTLLFQVLVIDSFDGQVAQMHVPGAVSAAGLTLALAVSVRDDGGLIAGDQLMIQD